MEDDSGTFALNTALLLIFFGLAAISATVVLVVGKIAFGKWYSWLALFGSSVAGGLFGVAILYFGAQFEATRSDTHLSSLNTMLTMVMALLLVLMVAVPLVTLRLRHRKKRIKELEAEVQRLKNSTIQ
jgi:hypothetical protein